MGYMTLDPYSPAFPKCLFTVDGDGTIYAAHTSNPRDSYHGYPYHENLGKRILDVLRKKALVMGCKKQFDAWVKKHITVAGKPDL